jgi:hypothetical protein
MSERSRKPKSRKSRPHLKPAKLKQALKEHNKEIDEAKKVVAKLPKLTTGKIRIHRRVERMGGIEGMVRTASAQKIIQKVQALENATPEVLAQVAAHEATHRDPGIEHVMRKKFGVV